MSFGHKSDVHKHLFPKHPFVSHRMAEDNGHIKIVEPELQEGLRLLEPPTKHQQPISIRSDR